MAYYWSDFRSTDTSVDPKGQKYKIVIFTDYTIGSNPYGSAYGPAPLHTQYPDPGTELTAGETPFTVEWSQGDDIHAPIRKSTASMTFVCDQPPQLTPNSDQLKSLCLLLKWNNDVIVEDLNYPGDGGRLYNKVTGQILDKQPWFTIIDDQMTLLWSGFTPYQLHKFAYTIEWMGFITPDVISCDFDLPETEITYNANDLLASLVYTNIDDMITGEERAAIDILLGIFNKTGVHNLYITDSIRFAPTFNQSAYQNIFENIMLQTSNFIDEDGIKTEGEEILKHILSWSGHVAVQYKDRVYITTPEALAENCNFYNVYRKNTGAYIIDVNNQSLGLHALTIYDGENVDINEDTFSSSGTQLTTIEKYKHVKGDVNIYELEDVLPKLDKKVYIIDEIRNVNTGTQIGDTYWRWNYNYPSLGINNFIFHQYGDDSWTETISDTGGWPTIYNEYRYSNVGVNHVDRPLQYYNFQYKPTCMWIESAVYEQGQSGSKQGMFYFHHRPWPWKKLRNNTIGHFDYYMEDMYDKIKDLAKTQKMLEFSTEVFMPIGNWIKIRMDWAFYLGWGSRMTFPKWWDTDMDSINVNLPSDYLDTAFVWAKISLGGYWLKNSSQRGRYEWSEDETYVQLWLDWLTESKTFGTEHKLLNPYSMNGLMVQLPQIPTFTSMHVEIYRPIGPRYKIRTNDNNSTNPNMTGCGSVATMRNLEIEVKTFEEFFDENYDKRKFDSEYATAITKPRDYNVTEIDDTYLTSDADTQCKNIVFRNYFGWNSVMTPVPNIATGIVDKNLYVSKLVHTANFWRNALYTISLETFDYNPLRRYTWSKFPGKRFICGSATVDYAGNNAQVDLLEIPTPHDTKVYRRNMNKRNYRNNELYWNDGRVPAMTVVVHDTDPYFTDQDSSIYRLSTGEMFAQTPSDPEETGVGIDFCRTIRDKLEGIGIYPVIDLGVMQFEVPEDMALLVTPSVINNNLIINTISMYPIDWDDDEGGNE